MRADLHTHSNASDGDLDPAELLRSAHAAGVTMLAITDHDTTAGLAGLPQSEQSGCKLIAGIELSTCWRKIGIHVVGLNIDTANAPLAAGIERQQEARQRRAGVIAARLTKLGLHDTLAGASQLAGTAAISRVHFARYLADSGQVRSINEAFRKYLGAGKTGDVKDVWASLEEVIAWIHGAGGTAVLAHPAKYKLTNMKLEELAEDFRAAGGDAIEVISGKQDISITRRLGKLANRQGLLASCGSDFHRPGASWAQLGEVAPLPADCTPVWTAWQAA
jgi:predicted metal-dependent phosphoesterase TrpH